MGFTTDTVWVGNYTRDDLIARRFPRVSQGEATRTRIKWRTDKGQLLRRKRQLFTYDPVTGMFEARPRQWVDDDYGYDPYWREAGEIRRRFGNAMVKTMHNGWLNAGAAAMLYGRGEIPHERTGFRVAYTNGDRHKPERPWENLRMQWPRHLRHVPDFAENPQDYYGIVADLIECRYFVVDDIFDVGCYAKSFEGPFKTLEQAQDERARLVEKQIGELV